jgi:hypothetical protein
VVRVCKLYAPVRGRGLWVYWTTLNLSATEIDDRVALGFLVSVGRLSRESDFLQR